MGEPGPTRRIDQRSASAREPYLLLALLLLATALRLYGLGDACYWLDEFYSLESSTGRGLAHATLPQNVVIPSPPLLTRLAGAPPWWRIWTSLDTDNHPPLYFLLLRGWRSVVPETETYLRLLSTVASLVAVGLFYSTVRAQIGVPGAVAAAAVLAVASSQVHFAQELRGYAVWAMLAAAAAWAVVAVERRGASRARLAVLALATLGMLLTHYFAAATALGLFIYAAIAFRGRTRRLILTTLVAAGLLYAVTWGPFMLRQRNTVTANNQWQFDPAPGHLVRTLERAALLPLRWLSETAVERWTKNAPWQAPTAIATAIAVAAGLGFARRDRATWFWFAFAAPLVAMVVTLDLARHARHLEVTRYTFVAGPAVCFLIGLAVARLRHPARWAIPAAVVALCAAGLPGAYADLQDWRLYARAVHAESRPGDVVVYASAGREPWWAGSTYLGVSHYAPDMRHPILLMTDPPTAAGPLHAAVPAGSSVWLFCSRENVWPKDLIPDANVVQSFGAPNIGRVSQITLPSPAAVP
jgi:hypothetical protein